MHAGLEPSLPWWYRVRLKGGCGGRSLKEQRRALTTFTEAPIRQGVLASPWEALVAGLILGEAAAQRVLTRLRDDRRQQIPARQMAELTRPSWAEMVKATERILGRRWADMTTTYGDWGVTDFWRWPRATWAGAWPRWCGKRGRGSAGSPVG